MRASEQPEFVRGFILQFLDVEREAGKIAFGDYLQFASTLQGEEFDTKCKTLFARSPEFVEFEGLGRLRIVELREATGRRFPFLQGLRAGSTPPKERKCFVGFRFLPEIDKALKFNLSMLFEPYGVQLLIAGSDLVAQALFQDVVGKISAADLCIFDTLGTHDKPNVFIEIGIALALSKAFMICEYSGDGTLDGKSLPATGEFPSDLAHLFRVRYESYEDLCRQLYFRLPIFLEKTGLLE